jgi:hypothetical protein
MNTFSAWTNKHHFQSQHATRITVELVRNKTSQAERAWHLLSDDA